MRKDPVEASKALTDARNFLSFKNPNTFTDNKECSHQGTLSVDRMIKDSVLTITNLLLIVNDKDKDYARSVIKVVCMTKTPSKARQSNMWD